MKLEDYKKQKEVDHEYDVKMDNLRASRISSSGGSSSGRSSGGKSYSGSNGGLEIPTTIKMADKGRRDDGIKEYTKYTDSDEYKALNPSKKYEYWLGLRQQITSDVAVGGYGDNGLWTGDEILKSISKNSNFITDFEEYEYILGQRGMVREGR